MSCCNPRPSAAEETLFSVPAMTCRHCVRAISSRLHDVTGVVSVEADVASRTVRVRSTANADALRAAIAEAGYEAVASSPSGGGEEPKGDRFS